MIRALFALSLLACSRPEPRPPLPDLGATMTALDAIPGRVEALVERGCEMPMHVDIRAECYYPHRIAKMEVERKEEL